jgi:hypothetical protein
VAAPYAKGERFDLRYAYWDQKNHLILLIRNYGSAAPIVRSYLKTSLRGAVEDFSERMARTKSRAQDKDGMGALRAGVAALSRTAVVVAASVAGVVTGVRLAGEDRRR